ncbi:MAG TPA: hypothetical protein VMK65_03330, partial [Longimicrobiales bacterium]|nr:hypothetical protein [Longimicrobiales bacterium]
MATTAPAATDRLGDLLVREGIISAEQLNNALADARTNSSRLGYSLIKLGFVAEDVLTRMLAKQYHVPAVDLDRVTVDPKILKLVPGDLAMKHQVLPLRRVGRTLTLAMANPTDASAIDNLKFVTRHDIEPVVVGEYTLRKHLERYYDIGDERLQSLLDEIGDAEIEVVEQAEEEVSIAALQAQVDDAPVVKLINGLLTDAVLKGVSDIHIEPYEKE